MIIYPYLAGDDDVALELDRGGDTVTLYIEAACLQSSDLVGDDYYYGNLSVGFNGQTASTAVDYSLDQSAMFLDLPPTTLTAGVVATGSFLANYDPTYRFSVILFDSAATYVGTSGADYIFGSSFADRLSGGGGDDGIEAGAGDDWLNGGAGADVLDGGAGNDTASYASASAGVVASLVDPSINTGDAKGDRYISIENLEGTSYADRLYGDSGSNVLTGGGGDDWLSGGSGGDVYDGGAGQDTASYASATKGVRVNLARPSINTGDAAGDVFISIENLTGSSYHDLLIGDSGANAISGGGGNDVIAGRGGADTLSGGGGYNTFVFDTPLNLNGGVATIVDYSVAFDRIRLKPSVFTALTPGLSLADNEFHSGPAATTSDQHILYNGQTGAISYDPDGSGAASAVIFTRVAPGLAMSASEFAVI